MNAVLLYFVRREWSFCTSQQHKHREWSTSISSPTSARSHAQSSYMATMHIHEYHGESRRQCFRMDLIIFSAAYTLLCVLYKNGEAVALECKSSPHQLYRSKKTTRSSTSIRVYMNYWQSLTLLYVCHIFKRKGHVQGRSPYSSSRKCVRLIQYILHIDIYLNLIYALSLITLYIYVYVYEDNERFENNIVERLRKNNIYFDQR